MSLTRLLWWALWLASLVPAAIAFILLIPEWLARLAALLIWPARVCLARARGPRTPAEHVRDLERAGLRRGYGGAWVKGQPNRKVVRP